MGKLKADILYIFECLRYCLAVVVVVKQSKTHMTKKQAISYATWSQNVSALNAINFTN